MKAKAKKKGPFEKVGEGLLRYVPTGKYYARIQVDYKEVRRSLRTTDPALAKRRLHDLRSDLEHTGASGEQLTLRQLCDRYLTTVMHLAPKTVATKQRAGNAVKTGWPGGSDVLISKVRHSQVEAWLAHYKFGAPSYNHYLEFVRAAFALAINDRLLAHSPVEGIKTKKRTKPIRDTPTEAEFEAVVKSIREQRLSDTASDSGDLIEFMGLAGLGQAEVRPMKWQHIKWEDGWMTAFRAKTKTEFPVPIYPKVRLFLEELRRKRVQPLNPSDNIFRVKDAKKAFKNACVRLNVPVYTQRSLRRFFITKALRRGVDVQSIAAWQGHTDGGKLVLQNYSETSKDHSAEMAKLMN